MDIGRFQQMVARLEQESAVAPHRYRTKVALLTLLGFVILALLLATVGLGLIVLAGFVVAMVMTGGAALVLLLKLGKLLLVLAIPLYFLVKSAVQALFIRLPAPQGRSITREEAPSLYQALDDMRERMKGPRFHHVLIVDDVNAAIVQRPALGIIGWPRNYLLLGLPLLEGMPANEALAVVAHEYGHLAGSHGHFSAFVYRLRLTWEIVEAYTEQIQGWLGRLVAPVVRWYAPYFNAYTFVLARANEYQADAAAADLVGIPNASNALKRVNLVAPQHQRFMQQTFGRIDYDPTPPQDLMHRWAAHAGDAVPEVDARRWLNAALDREGRVSDTHPTLRARLVALSDASGSLHEPPPPWGSESAAEAWFGPLLERLRVDMQAQWAQDVSAPWSERHAEARQARQRLDALRAQTDRDPSQEIEIFQLTMRLEPESDVRQALAEFNAAHPDHALGLFLEASARLDKGERTGLELLDRVMALDPEATKPACERAHAYLVDHQEPQAAEIYAERWRRRNELEALRSRQLETPGPGDELVSHGLTVELISELKARLTPSLLKGVEAVYLARRVIPADPGVVQLVMGIELTWWGGFRNKQGEVINRLAALSNWPVPLLFIGLKGPLAPLKKKFRSLPDAGILQESPQAQGIDDSARARALH